MEAAMDAGADDIQSDEEEHTILTAPDQLYAVASALRSKGLQASAVRLNYIPGTVITLSDVQTAKQVLKLYDLLDDLDDTQNVYANFEISDDIADQLDP
jgi:transcriptional/translational regulatory protein YebC/TACO1